jgi:hypothetical protein
MPAMEKRPFGQTGLSVSALGFGTAPIGILKLTDDQAGGMLNLLLDNGVNLIDTAANYAEAEVRIGNTIAHRRDQFVLVSKCGGKLPDIDAPAWSPQLIEQTIDRSLRRLSTDHLDVMLLHRARNAGKIRHAGYSGDNQAVAHAVSLPDIAVIQTSISITDQVNIDPAPPTGRRAASPAAIQPTEALRRAGDCTGVLLGRVGEPRLLGGRHAPCAHRERAADLSIPAPACWGTAAVLLAETAMWLDMMPVYFTVAIEIRLL